MIKNRTDYNSFYNQGVKVIEGFKFDEVKFLINAIADYKAAKELAVWHLLNGRFDNAREILYSEEKIGWDSQYKNFYEIMGGLIRINEIYQLCIKNNKFPEQFKPELGDLLKIVSTKSRLLKDDKDKEVIRDIIYQINESMKHEAIKVRYKTINYLL